MTAGITDRSAYENTIDRSRGKIVQHPEQRVAHLPVERNHAREFAARHIGWIYDHGQTDTIVQLASDTAKALDKGANGDAIIACRRALALNPHHASSLHCLALAEWRAGYRTKPLSDIAHALAVDDCDPALVAMWTEMNAETTGQYERKTAIEAGKSEQQLALA